MPRRLEGRDGIEVYPTERGQIAIKQDASFPGEEDSVVLLDVNDVSTIVQWLQDVAVDAAEIRRMNEQEAEETQVDA